MNRKQERQHAQRHAVRERLSKALDSLYHAATPNYPDLHDAPFADEFDQWFSDACSAAIDQLEHYYEYTFDAKAAKQGWSDPLWNLLEYAASRESVREDTRKLGQPTYRYVVRVYTWGRGGRTCAPLAWVTQRGGGSFTMKDDTDFELCYAKQIEMIQCVEAFYDFVKNFCNGIPEAWKEYVADRYTTREEHLEEQAVD